MGKRTKLKSKYRKRSKRTRKYSFKKRKTTRKRRKQKGGADSAVNEKTIGGKLNELISKAKNQEIKDLLKSSEIKLIPKDFYCLNAKGIPLLISAISTPRIESDTIITILDKIDQSDYASLKNPIFIY